ncbi:MAG: FeoB-associated Cys-rich membrane protein [Spirochaetaceae bacterium]|jgi:hypothetical protein|nr:FeoB-associated Cys-rich membrane protein [Spirochaetaceae bacterium]
MDFIRANAGTIIVGSIVFGVLALIIVRLIVNLREGRTSCGCGCEGCSKRG